RALRGLLGVVIGAERKFGSRQAPLALLRQITEVPPRAWLRPRRRLGGDADRALPPRDRPPSGAAAARPRTDRARRGRAPRPPRPTSALCPAGPRPHRVPAARPLRRAPPRSAATDPRSASRPARGRRSPRSRCAA